jgi:hypothetical protein
VQWRSTRTFAAYAVSWRLDIESAGLALTVAAPAGLEHQEVLCVTSWPGHWQGAVSASGLALGAPVTGHGVLRAAPAAASALVAGTAADFLASVGAATRANVKADYPDFADLTHDKLVAVSDFVLRQVSFESIWFRAADGVS